MKLYLLQRHQNIEISAHQIRVQCFLSFLNSIEIPIDKNIDDGNVTDFRDFTIPLNLNNYEEVKLIGKNYKEFPDLPVFHKKQKRKVWIFIDEIIFW